MLILDYGVLPKGIYRYMYVCINFYENEVPYRIKIAIISNKDKLECMDNSAGV